MRALAPWRPFPELSTLRREMDDLFARVFGDWDVSPAALEPYTVPVEWFLRDGELVVHADLPGIDPKDADVSLEGDRLTIRGERKARYESDPLYREIRYGRFERTVRLPEGIDPDQLKASYKDGVLEITMPAPKGFVTKKVPITVH